MSAPAGARIPAVWSGTLDGAQQRRTRDGALVQRFRIRSTGEVVVIVARNDPDEPAPVDRDPFVPTETVTHVHRFGRKA